MVAATPAAGTPVDEVAKAAAEKAKAAADAIPKKDADADLHFRITLAAGPRDIGVAFLMRDHAEDTGLREPFMRLDNSGGNGVNLLQPHLASVMITGPFASGKAQTGQDTPSRQRIFVCHPEAASDETECATKIFTNLARRAYRRPATAKDVKILLASYQDGRKDGDFQAGIEVGLRRLLVSPEFLFRVERDPLKAPSGTNYNVSDIELASRLSFFLWSSIPDDQLLDLAIQGKLRAPETLHKQVRRMLADSRSKALATSSWWILMPYFSSGSI